MSSPQVEPFPRSRHTFCGVPSRHLCLLSGGRSVKANTVLSDLWALDVEGALWARLETAKWDPADAHLAVKVDHAAS